SWRSRPVKSWLIRIDSRVVQQRESGRPRSRSREQAPGWSRVAPGAAESALACGYGICFPARRESGTFTHMRRSRMHARKMVRKGFTLVEILIVVVILGILAAIVIPQFTNASESAQFSSTVSQLQTI